MIHRIVPFAVALAIMLASTVHANSPIKVLILDGQNNHNWKATTPMLKKAFAVGEGFSVDVATSPPNGSDMSKFSPKFSDYDVVVSNYNGDAWSKNTQKALIDYVKDGGGLVIVHAADNSFPKWKEYNEMIGLGGWGGRTEKSGPYVYFQEGRFVRDVSKGNGGSHGPQHAFQVIVRDANHPITDGMPPAWMHAKDELYDSLRGPAENMRVLATAYSEKSGRHEPMMMTIQYGDGRIFHTPMGHSDLSMKCAGFVNTLQRGTQWAATESVTSPIDDDFPKQDTISIRDY